MRTSHLVRRALGVAACAAMAVGLAGCPSGPRLTVTPTTLPASGGPVTIRVDDCPADLRIGVNGEWPEQQQLGSGPFTKTFAAQALPADQKVRAWCGTTDLGTAVVDVESPQMRLLCDPNAYYCLGPPPHEPPDEHPTGPIHLYGSDCPAGTTASVTVPRGTPRVVTAPIDAQGDWHLVLPPIAAAAPGRSPKITLRASCGSLTYPNRTFDPTTIL